MDLFPYNKQSLTNYFYFHLFPEAHSKIGVLRIKLIYFLDSKFDLCKTMFYGVKAKDEAAIKNKKFDFVTSVQDFCL